MKLKKYAVVVSMLAVVSFLSLDTTAQQPKPRLAEAKMVVAKAPEAHARLARLLIQVHDRMSAAAGVHSTLLYSPDAVFNAFATHNKGVDYVAFFRPLVQEFQDDPDALAYVVGHEIGHQAAGHTTQGRDARAAIGALATIVGAVVDYKLEQRGSRAAGTAQLASSAIGSLVILKFTRDQEREADALGLRMMASAGYDPRGAIRAQEAMLRRSGNHDFVLFDSHPSSQERLGNLRAQIQAEPLLLASTQRPSSVGSAPTAIAAVNSPADPSASAISDRTGLSSSYSVASTQGSFVSNSAVTLWNPNPRLLQLQKETEPRSARDRADALKRLADEGDQEAKAEYASMLISGQGVQIDRPEGCRLAKEAWTGHAWNAAGPWALCLGGGLGGGRLHDDRKAGVAVVSQAWDEHRVRSALAIKGRFYELGYGVERDIGIAESIYREAALHGDSAAAYRIGKMMQSGQLVGYTPEQVESVMREAATHGHVSAMVEYAEILRGRDVLTAHSWVSLASMRGESRAPALAAALASDIRRAGGTPTENAHEAAAAQVRYNSRQRMLLPR